MAKKIGKYELHEDLGKGGFGTVYRATDRALEKVVALKVLHPYLTGDPGATRRFEQEARTAAQLDHPNIVPVYDVGQDGEYHYIAMKYLPGGSLADRIARGPLPFDEALAVLRDACAGLQEAHQKGLIHRDLKPANLLFDAAGRAVITDFGLAKALSGDASESSSSQGGVGTPFYRAPEVWKGSPPASPASDVYALGCIFYEMLTGQVLFDGPNPYEVMFRHAAEGANIHEGWQPQGAPAGLREVLLEALAKDPAARYASADAFRLAVEEIQQAGERARIEEERLQAEAARRTQAAEAKRQKDSQEQAAREQLKPRKVIADTSRPKSPPGQPLTGRWFYLIPVLVLAASLIGLAANFVMNPPASPPATNTPSASTTGVPEATATYVAALLTQSAATAVPSPAPTHTAPAATRAPAVPAPQGGVSGKIAFASNRDGNYEIYTMNADGSNPANLTTNPADDHSPAWSPDGTRIAFVSERDGNAEIYVMNADGSAPTRLTQTTASEGSPSWSPDGTRIAFFSERDGNGEVYVMNADGSSPTRLTTNPATDNLPAWSPDGARIAFISFRDGNYEIYAMNADGSNQTRLTENTANDDSPSWSPDGTRIAFASDRDGNFSIFVMNVYGSNPSRLTSGGGFDIDPSWSPDGTRIAFVSDQFNDFEIYRIAVDGSDLTRLTTSTGNDLNPAWQPSVKP